MRALSSPRGSGCACAPSSCCPSAASSPTPTPKARKLANEGVGQFALAFAGPLANCATALALALTFLGAGGGVRLLDQPWISAAYLLRSMVWMQAGLGVLHLLPAYPLDGGRLLRGNFARAHGIAPAGRAATGLGQLLALAAMLGGMLLHSPWIIIAGFFIMIGAQIEDQGVFFQSVVDTVHMREVMLTDFATLSPSDTLADALGRCVHSLQEDFPVVRGPELVGIVSRQRIVDALRNDGNGYVQSIMSRAFQVARPEDTLGATIRRLTAGRGLSLIPVTESGRVVGIVSVQNLMSSMTLLAEKRRIEQAEECSKNQPTGPNCASKLVDHRHQPILPLAPGLYLVATPIGNLGDITLRALDVLRGCQPHRLRRHAADPEAAEPLRHHHTHRKLPRAQRALRAPPNSSRQSKTDRRIAVVSDAGMPGISDPGAILAAQAIAAGVPVIPIPGANAALSALIASGLPTAEFHFIGFLPEKAGARRTRLEALAAEARDSARTLIFYEAPHRIVDTLADHRIGLGTRAPRQWPPASSPSCTKSSCAAPSPKCALLSRRATASAANSSCSLKRRPLPDLVGCPRSRF